MELDTKSRIGVVTLLVLILFGLLGIYTLLATDWTLLYEKAAEPLPPLPPGADARADPKADAEAHPDPGADPGSPGAQAAADPRQPLARGAGRL